MLQDTPQKLDYGGSDPHFVNRSIAKNVGFLACFQSLILFPTEKP